MVFARSQHCSYYYIRSLNPYIHQKTVQGWPINVRAPCIILQTYIFLMSILHLKQPTPHNNVLHETPEYTTRTIAIINKRK
jgi:hypothetical protein